jgi:hypothetical protein
MIRALFIPILPLTLLFASMIGMVYALPGEDDSLTAFLAPPEGCPAPCWQGIRPGITSISDAIDILVEHPWIHHLIITESYEARGGGFIGWAWNGQQPALIDGRFRGVMWVSDGIVRSVRIPTTITFGALWLRLHRPARGSFRLALDAQAMDHVVIHLAAYPDHKFVAWNEVKCPLRLADFWGAHMSIQFTNNHSADLAEYRLPGWAFESPCG